MSVQDKKGVMFVAELEPDEAIDLIARCRDAGVSVDEKVAELCRFFLAEGDNHLKTA